MINLTREIWKTFGETASERAANLLTSCSDLLQDFYPVLYLDVGTGLGYNTSFFSANAKETVGLDLRILKDNILRKSKGAHLIGGDGRNLPLVEGTADMVSLFSVIEHVPNPELLLKEVFRVLRCNGILIVQVPNRFFLVELHSGFPLFYFIPTQIRNLVMKGTGYSWLREIDVPSLKKLIDLIQDIEPQVQIVVRKVKYSPSIIIPNFRTIYRFISGIGLLDLIPIGYLVIVKKTECPMRRH
jgi:SAM-dependent methyltransferase